MRLAFLLPAVLVTTGCGVPSVTFNAPDGSRDATRDVSATDGETDAEADGHADAESDAGADAADAADAGIDAPEYCKGDAGPPTGAMYKCCGSAIGIVCSGNCNAQQCLACGVCPWPGVCCPTMGNMAHCSTDGGC